MSGILSATKCFTSALDTETDDLSMYEYKSQMS